MKKLIASAVIALVAIAITQVNAQTSSKAVKKELKAEKREAHKELRKLEGEQVSTKAKDNFWADFGEVTNPKWTRSGEFDEVTFTKDGQTKTAYYDYDSNLVGTTSTQKFADLPERGQKIIKTKYKDYKPGAVIMFDDNENNESDMLFMGTRFEDADNYFVTLLKGGKETIVQVNMDGDVSFFK